MEAVEAYFKAETLKKPTVRAICLGLESKLVPEECCYRCTNPQTIDNFSSSAAVRAQGCVSKGVFLTGFLRLAVSKSTGEFDQREDNRFPTLLHHCLAGRPSQVPVGETPHQSTDVMASL